MSRVEKFNWICLVLNVLLAGLFILANASLVRERSQDIVRITVWGDELLPTVRQLQGVTHKVAYAYPVGKPNSDPNAEHWRIVIDNRSESTD